MEVLDIGEDRSFVIDKSVSILMGLRELLPPIFFLSVVESNEPGVVFSLSNGEGRMA